MKIKNTSSFILILIFITFSSNAFAKNKNFIEPKTDITKYLGLDEITPSQFSTISIKYYFKDLQNQLNTEKHSYSNEKNKTTLFNESLTNYVKGIYNLNSYANFLSQNGTHVVEFLELGNELDLNTQSLYTGIRLFYNKIKSCELIDDSVIIQILEAMPMLEKYFDLEEEYKTPSLESLTKNIEHELLFHFTEHLKDFNTQPNNFIKELSYNISQMTKDELQEIQKLTEKKEIRDRLRQITIRFFEIALSKTIWNQLSPEGVWNSVISIANGLQLLGVHGIIDHMDDLDDMLWSLTHRFCYFLDLTGSALPLDFYEEVESDLENKVVFFLEAQEQDEEIITKKETIAQTILKAKTKAIAFEEKGIFTDQLIDS
ncbi:hypothetical protein GF322_01470 [Candidatus Dependentiae bacterium]|nr:hypothetical protein [Candidatus Dependentiae bacterium]